MANILNSESYKKYESLTSSLKKFNNRLLPTVKGSFYDEVESSGTETEPNPILELFNPSLPSKEENKIRATKQRWLLALPKIQEVLVELTNFANLTALSELNEVIISGDGEIPDEDLEFIQLKINDSVKYFQPRIALINKMLYMVKEYDTVAKWDAYKQEVSDKGGSLYDDLTLAKHEIIQNIDKAETKSKTNVVFIAIVVVAIYFLFIK